MKLLHFFHLIKNYPFEILLKKISRVGFRVWNKKKQREKTLFGIFSEEVSDLNIQSLFSIDSIASPQQEDQTSDFLLGSYKEHRFDLLGSGWMEWNYNADAPGLQGWKYEAKGFQLDDRADWLQNVLHPNHLENSKRIFQIIQEASYEPIDWQRDRKSGFRWDASMWTGDQGKLHAGKVGADPKVPLELGRLQHLPRMALLTASKEQGQASYIREFRAQVLDFLSTNPPGMGINWYYSMDVGIRTANLLLAYDLFSQLDEEECLDQDFQQVFTSGIVGHARYIKDHLEFQDGLTGNHYLFNVAGLLFAGAYLDGPAQEEAREWLTFGLEALIQELFKQFLPDGGNFEGSTAYHRLAVEMMVWCTALVQGNKEKLKKLGWEKKIKLSKWSHGISGTVTSTADQPFPPEFLERLHKACEVTWTLTKPNGEHPQIGDNDSGRLFRLTPVGQFRTKAEMAEHYEEISADTTVFDENMLEQKTLLAAIMGLWDGNEFNIENPTVERDFIHSLAKGDQLKRIENQKYKEKAVVGNTEKFQDLSFQEENTIPLMKGAEKGNWFCFPHVGWYVYRAPDFHLLVNAPSGKGIRHTWGHVHNDRLSFELYQNGKNEFVDPGSYIYGALPEERNRFRSVKAHNTLIVEGEEQNRWVEDQVGLFFLEPETQCFLLDQDTDYLEVGLEYRGIRQKRKFIITEGKLILEDHSNVAFSVNFNKGELHSKGYGKKLKAP